MAPARASNGPRRAARKESKDDAKTVSLASDPRTLSPREVRRRQRIELNREQILDTAELLFSERGYHATGLKEVGELCEFSVGTIYSLFESKDELYAEVLLRRGRGQFSEMQRIVDTPGPANERLIEMARLQVEHFRRHPAWGRLTTRVLTVGAGQETALPDEFRRSYREAIDLEAQLIAEGQREGVIRPGAPRALARMFSALITAFHAMDPAISEDAEDLTVEEALAVIAQTFGVSTTS